MSAAFNTIDLAQLALKPGQGRRLDAPVRLASLQLGGESYDFVPDPAETRIDVSRTSSGYALRMRFAGALRGPCMRCLTESEFPIEVEGREVDQPGTGDEELSSPYVAEDELLIADWARDGLALALPQTLLCRPDCAGLCPVCGITLNDVEPGSHVHESEPDPRWAKLRELKLD